MTFQKGHTPWSKLHPKLMKANSGSFKKGMVPWSKGKHFSLEYRKKLSLAHKGKNTGSTHPNWNGGRYTDKQTGYIIIYCPNHPHPKKENYVYEHRFVVEKQIGRYLSPTESVHHLKEKSDNRPQMLMAFENESTHQKFHKNPSSIKLEEIIFDGRKLSVF